MGLTYSMKCFKSVTPLVVMYNTLIGFLYKGGELERVVEVECVMEWSGALTRPTTCTREDYNATEKMVFDMEYQECKPDR
ncbi:hypothetical protein QJS10_CPA06g00960 [Acorus calamus]|uniref:Uncharacterized protein n=1 Tax=Acorus calamus TaxID=4465 RepID=A0AAV9EJ03_ACOCL|nr:hypothetical protein QJS10_CPA06g00960 [Acorus calamus]